MARNGIPNDLRILQELCSVPTAPFAERYVIEYVRQFVSRHPRMRLSNDAAGNLLLEVSGTQPKLPRWVFTAHMDHPGFVADKMLEKGRLRAHFRGGVKAEYFKNSRVSFFEDDRRVLGVVQKFEIGKERGYPVRAELKVSGAVSTGSIGMWDQGEGRLGGGKFYSRVCDDLAGAAAALTMLSAVSWRSAKTTVAVLLTRGEEEGFIGAVAASLKPKLLKRSDRLVAMECSAMQPFAPQGEGAIIRIGDRTSVFNSDLSYFITQQAMALAKQDKKFKFQRALMPGGTCEATVYDVYGFTAAAICVALGNYHNMDASKRKIGPEFVDVGDYRSMVKLLVHLARNGHHWEPGHRLLKARLEKRYRGLARLL